MMFNTERYFFAMVKTSVGAFLFMIIFLMTSTSVAMCVEHEYRDILPPAWLSASCVDINDKGIVVGWGNNEHSISKGFLYRNGTYIELLPPGWIQAMPLRINNSGTVVGIGLDGNAVQKGFIYRQGTYKEVLPPGWSDTIAEDINDNGVVLGHGSSESFLPYGGEYYTGSLLDRVVAESINNKGNITGYFSDGYTTYGFITNLGRII